MAADRVLMLELVRLITQMVELAERIATLGDEPAGRCQDECPYRTFHDLDGLPVLPNPTAPLV